MEAKYIERLEQVVRVLEGLPREKRFNLSRWMQCGTVGCAVGWAARDPWFRQRGLQLKKHSWGNYHPILPRRKGRPTHSAAVMIFFGLASAEDDKLFYHWAYRRGSRTDVIRRLKAFIKQKQREAA